MTKQNNFRKIPKIVDVNLHSDKEQKIKKEYLGLTTPVPPIELMHLANKMPTRKKEPNYSKEYVKKIQDIGISTSS